MSLRSCNTLAMRGTTIAAAALAVALTACGTAQATHRHADEGTGRMQAAHPPINRADPQECRCELATNETADGLELTFYNHSGHTQTYVINIWRVTSANPAGDFSQRTTQPVATGHTRTVTVLWGAERYIAAAFAAEPDHVGIQADSYFSRPE